MDPRAVELINLELDGRLDAAGRAELDARLAAEPALRDRRAELRDLARVLAEAPAPDVPPDFGDGVLRRARLPRRATRPRRYWRGGLALAASALVAVIVLRVVEQQPPLAREQLTGTLAPATATVAVAARPGGLALAFDLPAAGELVIDFAGAGPLAAAADGGPAPRVEGRRIVVRTAGAGRTTLVVTGDVGGFEARLVRNGTVTPVTVRGS